MLFHIDLDEEPDEEFFGGLNDDELDEVLHEAIRAECAAAAWSMAAVTETVRRWGVPKQPRLSLHERLRAAERRRLERRGKRK